MVRGEVTPPHVPLLSRKAEKLVYFGSCFAERLYAGLTERYGWPGYSRIEVCNHFNPLSLANALESLESGDQLTRDDVYESAVLSPDALCFTTPFRRAIYDTTVDGLLARVAAVDDELRTELVGAQIFVLTLGMADVFRLKSDGRPICSVNHISSSAYMTEMLSPAEITAALCRIYAALQNASPGSQMVVTISPQRYFPATFSEGDHREIDFVHNQRTKARLRLAVDELLQSYPEIIYFPAFEIGIDERRALDPMRRGQSFVYVNDDTANAVVERFLLTHATTDVLESLAQFDRVMVSIERAWRHPELRSIARAPIAAALDDFDKSAIGRSAISVRLRNEATNAVGAQL